MSRERVRDARRVVVKVGTSSLTDDAGRLEPAKVDRFAEELCALLASGRELVCVSSGAIAAGLAPLRLQRRPTDMPTLQAAAAVGQSHLMDAYATAFESRGHVCGQVLLTRQDFVHRQQYVNALNTFQRLLALGAVPIVNENDTIATDEIRFGENDLLAALVANLVRADVLVLLSDVDGLHARGPDGPVVDEIEAITPEVEMLAGGASTTLGSGGMRSKLAAAKIATASGVPVVIARAGSGALSQVLEGNTQGTLFRAAQSKLASRKAWIAYAGVPRGRVGVDTGAREALVSKGRSLLAAGVREVDGDFVAGDIVDVAVDGAVFARGIVGFSADELRRIAGRGSSDIAGLLGIEVAREVVHRDELVVL
jgi:glutamate 5-kinase